MRLTLPPAPDAAGKRDGLIAKARNGMGPQAALLSEIVAAVPLAFWAQIGGGAEELVAAALAGEFGKPLLDGWVRAAVRQRSADWAQTLLRVLADGKAQNELALSCSEPVRSLIQILPPDRADAIVLGLLQSRGADALQILGWCEFAWSPALSRAALASVRQRNLRIEYALRHWLMETAALRMHPSVAGEAAVGWPEDLPPALREGVDAFIVLLQFRHDMHKELKP